MKLVEPDLLIQPIAPLLATSENSLCVALKVNYFTQVNAGKSIAIDMDFRSYQNCKFI